MKSQIRKGSLKAQKPINLLKSSPEIILKWRVGSLPTKTVKIVVYEKGSLNVLPNHLI